jgi:peptide/nickel transport system substrate-binding protein
MYRPLYWFGQVRTETVSFNEPLSLARPPTSTNGGGTVVIDLKGWRFSNGQRVDAQSVVFWMNMMMAEGTISNPACGGTCWAFSTAGGFPSNVVDYSAPDGAGGSVVDITFDGGYSLTWLLYNALSQITPMPEAWDITSLQGRPGSGGCGAVSSGEMTGAATNKACQRVWFFDTDDSGTSTHPEMSGDLDSYATNPLWQVVDGPWRLSNYDISNGQVTFVPNPRYSGTQRPIIARFVEEFYIDDAAVLAALAGGGPTAPDVAPILTTDLPTNNGRPGSTGPNLAQLSGRYYLHTGFSSGITDFVENFNSTGDGGVAKWLFRQLYIRQALQVLVDQRELIKTAAGGYGVPVYGPVPLLPASPFVSKQERHNQYGYDVARAKQLLLGHGWTINSDTADVCVRPGTASDECGKGIPRGTPLRFTLQYPNYQIWGLQLAVSEGSAWAEVGIEVNPIGEPFGTATKCKAADASACAWEIAVIPGWIFAPDYMPTGEYLFSAGAQVNLGSYDDAETNRLVRASEQSDNLSALYRYENYLAEQLPVIWQPNNDVNTFEVSKGLGGVGQLSLTTLTPEYWYWTTAGHS